MLSGYPQLIRRIVINANNKAVRVTENGVTETLFLVEGVYYVLGDGSADDLLEAFRVMLESHSGTNTYQIVCLFQVGVSPAPDENVFISITALGTHQFSLLFANGATTFDASLIGYPQTDIASGGDLEVESSLSSSALWSSNARARRFEPDGSWMRKRSRALSLDVKAVNRRNEARDIIWIQEHVHESRFQEESSTADPNRALNRFLQKCAAGGRFRWYDLQPNFDPDLFQADSGGLTLIGTYWFDSDFYPAGGGLGVRGNGVPTWSFTGHLLKVP